MTTKYDHCPYFYVIRHKKTGLEYMGAKWGKFLTHPDLLLKPNGYTTASDTVNEIIDNEGLNSFEIVEIVLESDIKDEFSSIFEYEQHRIRDQNAITNSKYLNGGHSRATISTRGSKPTDYAYWSNRANDHLIDFSIADKNIYWMFQNDDVDLPFNSEVELKKEQSIAVSIIQKFLRSRSLTEMRPSEVGLPPSYVNWRPDVLYQVIQDLTHNFAGVLKVQRKRRNV